jgi:hypothetical protein
MEHSRARSNLVLLLRLQIKQIIGMRPRNGIMQQPLIIAVEVDRNHLQHPLFPVFSPISQDYRHPFHRTLFL